MTQLLKYYFLQALGTSALHCNSQYDNTVKIYVGQLPLTLDDRVLDNIFSQYANLKQCRIIKGDSRGQFDHFCYAFVTMWCSYDQAEDIIRKVKDQYPSWKLNIKTDGDKPKNQTLNQNYNKGGSYNQGQYQQNNSSYSYNKSMPVGMYNQEGSSSQKIVGEKNCHILVREVWLGGIPEMCDQNYMAHLMSQFGTVDNMQIFPKFAFIKFKMVQEATTAFERAERLFFMFGKQPGFRIFFSDPSRRANIVSNHYQFDRNCPFIPILFLGFPPVTSANVDLQTMKNICKNYGNITNSYMRKNSNNQTRSYMLFTYENLKSAVRAKIQLNRRRDLLGDKRIEITLLMDQQLVMKHKDFSFTKKMFQSDTPSHLQIRKQPFQDRYYSQSMYNDLMPQIGYSTQQHNLQYHPSQFIDPSFLPQNYLPPPPGIHYNPNIHYQNINQNQQKPQEMYQLLQSVLEPQTNKNIHQPLPTKKPQHQKQENTSELINKILGMDQGQQQLTINNSKDRQPTWSGFLTWKGIKRVGVDGHSCQNQPQDYAINIMYTLQPEQIIFQEKNYMILEPTNSISEPIFKEYIQALKNKIGVFMNSRCLIYVMSKGKCSQEIQKIDNNQLLVVMQPTILIGQIKQKLQKCQQL